MSVTHDDIKQAVFGGFDGLVSVTGVIVALLASGTSGAIVQASVGLAAASAVGMGAGEYLSDEQRQLHRALVMAGATAVCTMLPVLPYGFFSAAPATVVSVMVALVLTAVVALHRSGGVRSWVESYSCLALAAGVTIVVALATGATG